MSVLVDKNTRLVVQGITGKSGAFHTRNCMEYGTNVEQGHKLLADSGLPIVTATDLDTAASEIVKLAKS